jgi:colanic acid/amylovoran biosynthesis glycosyltransferase
MTTVDRLVDAVNEDSVKNRRRFMSTGLRVLHLFREYLKTTENWAFNLIDNLPDTDVVVAAKEFKKCNFYSNNIEYLEFPLKKIEQNQGKLVVLLFNALVYQVLKLYPWYLAKTIGRVDLIHSHFSVVGWEYLKLARKLNVPHVVSFYGFDYENLPYTQPVWRERYRTLFEEAALFLCEGGHGARLLTEMGCPPEKVKIARLGVDIRNIQFHRRVKTSGELNLLQIATFIEKKGHLYTIGAFLEALQECPAMTLTLVGSDTQGIRAQLREIIKGNAAENKVTFIDRINYDCLYEFMYDYQVFIHPSCYSREKDCEGGAPVVILDAQATGMPVISTNHCDIPDEVVHERTGLLTPEKDVAELAQSIRRFYEMGSVEYLSFAESARWHVEENYDVSRNAATVASIYRQLLK